MTPKSKCQLGLFQIDENRLTINRQNPENVVLTNCFTVHDSDGIVNNYNLTDPDPNYFLSNAIFKKFSFVDEFSSETFHKDAVYDLN